MMTFEPKLHTEKLKHLCLSEGEKQGCLKRRFVVTTEGDHWGREKRGKERGWVRKSNRVKVERKGDCVRVG